MPVLFECRLVAATALLCGLSCASIAGTIYINDSNSTFHATAARATAGFGVFDSHLDQSLGNSLSVNTRIGNSVSSTLGNSLSSQSQGGSRLSDSSTARTRDESTETAIGSGNIIVNTITQQSDTGGAWYRFALSYARGVGYTFMTTSESAAGNEAAASHTLIWSDIAGVINDGNKFKSRSALNGESATAAPIHALFLSAQTSGDSPSLEWANLAFAAAGQTALGSLTDGTTSTGGTQTIMSNADFRSFDWSLTGRIRTNGGTPSALPTRFVVDMTDGSFQHLETVPLPTSTALAGAGLFALVGRRRRMA